jgi:hypothetical protein
VKLKFNKNCKSSKVSQVCSKNSQKKCIKGIYRIRKLDFILTGWVIIKSRQNKILANRIGQIRRKRVLVMKYKITLMKISMIILSMRKKST